MAAVSSRSKVLGRVLMGAPIIGTFSLGIWQARRYTEKVEQIAGREAGLAAPPGPAPSSPEGWEALHYRRVAVRGAFMHGSSILIGPRSPPQRGAGPGGGGGLMSTHGRETGYLLVTPLKVGGGGTIFVNRGWVPASIKAAIPKEMLPEGECSLVVVPRPSEKGGRAVMDNDPSKDFWLKIDAPAMARHLGMREDLPFCDLVEPDGGGKPPINKTTADFITFYCTPLTHAAYSFTWFSLSAALAAGTHLRFR